MMNSDRRPRARVPLRYLLVSLLFVLSAVAFLDRTNISIAGVQIGREFRIDNTHLGWVFSAFLIGYATFQIPAGLLAKRLGSRIVLTLGVAWWGVFTVLTALVPPGIVGAVWILAAVRFGLGAGEATMYPAASQFVERWFPIEERGKANGLIFGGVGIGSGLTPPLVAAITLHYGWRASFWFSAAVGALAGLVWYLAARDTPAEHPLIGSAEEARIEAGRRVEGDIHVEPHSFDPVSPAMPWTRIFANSTVIALTVSYFSFAYVAWIFFAWFYIYMAKVRGLDLKSSALYAMLPFLAMTIGCLSGGMLSDRIARRYSLRLGRCLLPGIAMALTGVLLVAGSRAHTAQAAGLILACGAGVLYIAQSGFWAVTADVAGDNVGVVSGVMNMGGQVGGASTAFLTPLIAAHFGWEVSFVAAASLALLGALAWIVIDPASRSAVTRT